MSGRRFWIRKDREEYFLSGVILACTIGGFVSSYWHFTDRITVRQNIQIRKTAPTPVEQRKLFEFRSAHSVEPVPVYLRQKSRQPLPVRPPLSDPAVGKHMRHGSTNENEPRSA